MSEATLDQKAIDEIRAIPSPNLLNRMIQLYHDHTPRLLHEGRGAIAAGECNRVAVAAHELKSAAPIWEPSGSPVCAAIASSPRSVTTWMLPARSGPRS